LNEIRNPDVEGGSEVVKQKILLLLDETMADDQLEDQVLVGARPRRQQRSRILWRS